MIKWDYYLKYGKRLFSTLLISCFGLLGSFYVNAGDLKPVGTFTQSIYDNSYQLQVISKGSFLTQYLGTTKDVFAMKPQDFFIWTPDGRIYAHQNVYTPVYGNNVQEGYLNGFYACSEFTGSISTPTNCSYSNFDNTSVELFSNFLKTVNSSDYYFYDLSEAWYGSSIGQRMMTLCISSHTAGQSLCFLSQYHSSSYGCPGLVSQTCPGMVDSLGLGIVSFGQLNGSPSPAVIPGQIEGGSSIIGGQVGLTGDLTYAYCSNQNALDWYERQGYSNRLCYGGLNNFSTVTGVVPIAGQGLEFTDLWFEMAGLYEGGVEGTGMSDIEWFTYWRGLYDLYKKGVYSVNPFRNCPTVLFTYFGFVDVYGGKYSNKSILEYCNIKNHYTTEYLTQAYSGVNQDSVCLSPISFLSEQVHNNLSNASGYAVSSDWSGILSGGSNSGNTFTNGVNYVSSFFTELKNNYRLYSNDNVFGFIPSYIVLALMGLILFRFISH